MGYIKHVPMIPAMAPQTNLVESDEDETTGFLEWGSMDWLEGGGVDDISNRTTESQRQFLVGFFVLQPKKKGE